MAAAHQNLVVEQGTTFSLQLTWQDDAGAPIDLTGYQIRAQIRPYVRSSLILLELDSTTPGPGVTFGPLNAAGLIDITVTDEVTAALNFRRGVYDLEAESPAGVTTRLLEGAVCLSREVTR